MSPAVITNPILRGFNPDPSIVRVGEDYYIATSTFEWFPGVQIHHSRDLVHWQLVARPLNRPSQLNMLGNPDSCGVWAPALRHVNGLFHLIYTDLKRYGRTSGAGGAPGASLRDIYNYLVTAPSVTDDWSDPVFLNSSGFDPSFFADDDGRQYVLNQLWDHRPGHNRFNGIVLQEYSPAERRLVGERKRIFEGTHLGLTEAPHIHKRDGWYYLLTAEGGTGWGHAASLARSRDLLGPYELHPDGPLLTSRDRPDAVLQRAGHADWVDTPEGETFLVHLCGRPLRNRGRCTLGRETAIQRLVWADGWPRLAHGDAAPALTLAAPNLPAHEAPAEPVRTEFGGPTLPIAFQWLRSPFPDELFSLTERPGFLRLFGRESMGSSFRQALVARRQQAHCFSARTCMEYEPAHYQQSAGLVCYYGANKFHYLYVTQDEEHGRHLRAMSALPDAVAADSFTAPIALPPGPVHMRVEVDEERLRFAYSLDAAAWAWLPELLDASILSDEAAAPGTPNFTGAFVGMCCQDTAGTRLPADFAWFEYHERPYQADPVS
jgi:xylan 1,4-beta-xylosidase